MDWLIPRAAYLHIPFCDHHCGYCDFAVSTESHLKALYLEAIALEMQGPPAAIDTIFIGGGTPTSLSLAQLQRLLTTICNRFPQPVAEFSIESTPDSITPEKMHLLAEHGVTRVSVGVQSFAPSALAALDRQHGVEQIHDAIAAVRRAGLGLSLDLIFGSPGQTLADWNHDLTTAIALQPDHISTYGLTYEKGTPLWKRRSRGEVHELGEDAELAMYETSIRLLTDARYEHYETSNFAKPGHRCRHNEHYWANNAYYGFGVGAARYCDGERSTNVRDTRLYIQRILASGDATQQRERLTPRERAVETMAIQLRRCDGINRDQFAHQTGFTIDTLASGIMPQLQEQKLILDDGSRICLTHRGKCLADSVIELLMTSD